MAVQAGGRWAVPEGRQAAPGGVEPEGEVVEQVASK